MMLDLFESFPHQPISHLSLTMRWRLPSLCASSGPHSTGARRCIASSLESPHEEITSTRYPPPCPAKTFWTVWNQAFIAALVDCLRLAGGWRGEGENTRMRFRSTPRRHNARGPPCLGWVFPCARSCTGRKFHGGVDWSRLLGRGTGVHALECMRAASCRSACCKKRWQRFVNISPDQHTPYCLSVLFRGFR